MTAPRRLARAAITLSSSQEFKQSFRPELLPTPNPSPSALKPREIKKPLDGGGEMGEWGGERTGGAPPSGQARGVGGGRGMGGDGGRVGGPVGGEKGGPAPMPPHPRAGGIAWAGLG